MQASAQCKPLWVFLTEAFIGLKAFGWRIYRRVLQLWEKREYDCGWGSGWSRGRAYGSGSGSDCGWGFGCLQRHYHIVNHSNLIVNPCPPERWRLVLFRDSGWGLNTEVAPEVDATRLSSRTSLELEFEDLVTTSSKMGCIWCIACLGNSW